MKKHFKITLIPYDSHVLAGSMSDYVRKIWGRDFVTDDEVSVIDDDKSRQFILVLSRFIPNV